MRDGAEAARETTISPLAAVASGARLGVGCTVGPFAVVEDGVEIGDGSELAAHAVVRRGTQLGRRCVVHPFAVLGGEAQDRRHQGGETALVAGDDNVFREHVTAHRGTSHGGGVTRIGSGGLFMASAHVAHDCQVGDGVVLANGTLLGGHVHIGDFVVSGGLVAIAPFVHIGERAFLAGGAMVERDVPPWVIASGDRARVRGLNRIGMDRAGLDAVTAAALAMAFRRIYRGEEPRLVAAAALAEHADGHVRRFAAAVHAATDDPRRRGQRSSPA
jgi:UDP-N-acetylglucosamine acyltransferase